MTSFTLHILAMAFMLCDHLWATIVPGNTWLTNLGRLAFPIFAFLIVEGYRHTHDLKSYIKRLLVLALVSEIPFDLMYGGTWFWPFHQNVIWTYLIGIVCMFCIDKAKALDRPWIFTFSCIAVPVLGFLLATITMVDYYGYGILMILTFYFFKGNTGSKRILQLLALLFINGYLMRGLMLNVKLFGMTFTFAQQALACFALIPIGLYKGEHGPYNTFIRSCFYWFYPLHILILATIWVIC